MNWVLAAVIFIIAFMIGVPVQTDQLPPGAIIRDERVQITNIIPDSAAAKAGMAAGDFLISLNNVPITRVSDAQSRLKADTEGGTPIRISFAQGEEIKTVTIKPEYVESLKRPGLGVALADTGIVRFPWHRAILQGVSSTWMYTKLIIGGLYGLLRDLIVQQKVTTDVSGPVGIAVMTGRIARQGWWSLAQFTALLSLNLAVINFLPIPALDGGRAIFVFIESLRRRRTSPRFEALTHQFGFFALLLLIAIVTVHDLRQYGGVILRGLGQIIGL